MGIDIHQWRQINESGAKGTALSAGYPDLLFDMPAIPERPDGTAVREHHGFKDGRVVDSVAAFESIGLSLDVIDREIIQGSEHVINLNEPQELGEFDLVIDPGTTEHCFNIAQAWCNLGAAVRVGGFLSQALPMAMFNHGYWNVNPIAMLDFWQQNGFEVKECILRFDDGGIFDMAGHAHDRLKAVPDGAVVSMLAQRKSTQPFRWPQQQLPT